MSVEHLVRHVDLCIDRAERNQSKLPEGLLTLPGMSGRKTRHLYNNLLDAPNVRYLEVGVCGGSSFLSAAYDNAKSFAVAVDNWSEFGGPREEFISRMQQWLAPAMQAGTARLVEGDCFLAATQLSVSKGGPFNIYLYDGHHSESDQQRAVTGLLELLNDVFILVIDDWAIQEVQDGTHVGILASGLHEHHRRTLISRDDGEGFWNGYAVFVMEKAGSGQAGREVEPGVVDAVQHVL